MRFTPAPFRAATTQTWCRPLILGAVLGLGSCQKAPDDLREWSPKDHTNTSNKPAEQTGQVNASPAPAEAPPKGLDPVTLATWGSQCSSCHGKIGKGDGPNGKMLKATDLSNPAWQAGVTDEQITASILGGKNAMPAFGNLPQETVQNLVWLVRWFNSDQGAVQARMERLKSSAPSAAPEPAATPSAAKPTAVVPTGSPAGRSNPALPNPTLPNPALPNPAAL